MRFTKTSEPPVIAPFRGLRYSKEKVPDLSQVVSPPYDVISPEHQGRLYERSPYNVVRLILGRESEKDSERDNRYTRAARDYQQWQKEGILVRDERPAIYLYEQGWQHHTRRGFIALRRLEEFGEGIRPHENTLPGPKADRLKLIQECHANFSPIFTLYQDQKGEVPRLLSPFFSEPPEIDMVDEEHVCHRLWRLTDPDVIRLVSERMAGNPILIADGHHRYEVGLAYRNWMREKYQAAGGRALSGTAPWALAPFNYIMMYFAWTDDPGLLIFPTHRVLLSPPPGDPASLLARLREHYEVESYRGEHRREFFEALDGMEKPSFGLIVSREEKLHVISALRKSEELDVVFLHRDLFRGLLGITEGDERDPQKIAYIKEEAEVFKRVNESVGGAPPRRIGIFLRAPTPEKLLQAVQKKVVLPPKTTYFYPKLITGLVINPIYPEERV